MIKKIFYRLFSWNARHPVITLAAVGLLVLFSAFQLTRMEIADTRDSFTPPDDPERVFYNTVSDNFVTDQMLLVALATEKELFSKKNLTLIRKLSEEFDAIDGVDSLLDLSTIKYFEEGDGSFEVIDLLPETIPDDPEDLSTIKERVKKEPLYRGNVISDSMKVAVIQVRLEAGLESARREAAVRKVEEICKERVTAAAGLTYHITGQPVIDYYNGKYMKDDLQRFTPIAYLLMIVVLFVVQRRVAGVLVSLLVLFVMMVISYGVLVTSGGSMNNATTMVPPIAIIMTVAVIIHCVNEYKLRLVDYPHKEAVLKTIEGLTVPVFYTSLTTAIGFSSLTVSGVPAIRQFGIAMGLFMIVLFFVSMASLSALLPLIRPDRIIKVARTSSELVAVNIFSRLGAFNLKLRWGIFALTAVLLIASIAGIFRLNVETNPIEMFPHDKKIYRDTIFFEEEVSGISTFYISLKGSEEDRFMEPAVLEQVERLERDLEDKLGATNITSFTTFVKTMHRSFNGGGEAYYSLPDTRAKIAQLMMLNTDERIYDVVNDDYSWAMLLVWFKEHSSTRLLDLKNAILRRMEHLSLDNVEMNISGTPVLDAKVFNEVARSQVYSLMIAMVIIFSLMFINFRSFFIGAMTILPNALPILVALGIMGIFRIDLNASTAVISSVAIGIAVDDTIHYFSSYKKFAYRGLDARSAVIEALKEKGSAMFFTTAVITLGFSVLLISNFKPTFWFGLLVGISMIVALAGDVFVAPALIAIFKPSRKEQGPASPAGHKH